MAVPYVVATLSSIPTRTGVPLPPQAQEGDLILLVVNQTRRISPYAPHSGSFGSHSISGAVASLGVVGSTMAGWTESKWISDTAGYITRGESYRTQVRAATVPDNPSVVTVRHSPGSGASQGWSGSSARVVIVRNAAGVGASSTHQWRVPTGSDQALGFFVGIVDSVPAGVDAVQGVGGTWTAPSSGPHAGPGGAIDRSGSRNQNRLLGLEIVGTSGPAEPVITEPVDGSQVANGVPVEVAWAHQPARPGGHQGAYRLQVTTVPEDPEADPVVRWWDGLGLVASETTVESNVSRVELPPSVIGQDATLSVAVATQEALDGEWSLYSAGSSFSSVEPPTVTVTGPSGPVHNTMRPVVEWDGQPAAGEVLVQYHVRITNETGSTVFNSGGMTGSPGVYAVPALGDWVNGAEYVPWVRVRQTGGAWSGWEQGDSFTVTWTEPATPEVTAAPGRNGIEITVEDPIVVGGLELAAEVQRADGDDWVPVALAAQGGTATDVLAPYGQEVTYRARTSNVIADVTVYSEWAESNPATSRDRFAYLADAVDPARWVRLVLAHAVPHEHPRQIETTYGLGDSIPMVDKGPELGLAGTMTVRTATPAEQDRLIPMLEDTPRLVFRRPAEQRYAGNTPWHDRGTTVLTVNTGIDIEPVADNYPLTLRRITFGWVEQ